MLDLLLESVWRTNDVSVDMPLRLSIPFSLHICWLESLKLGSGLSSDVQSSSVVGVVGTLNLVSPIVIYAKTWSLSSLLEATFTVGDDFVLP